MNKFIFISFIALSISTPTGCTDKSVSFTKEKWNEWDGHYYSRKYLINDVLNNHLKKGMAYSEVINLLGETHYKNTSDGLDTNDSLLRISYEIDVEYKFLDIDPYKGKDLVIVFRKDSLLSSFKLIDWQSGKP